MGSRYACAWCDKKFDNVGDRNSHEGGHAKEEVGTIPTPAFKSVADPLAGPSLSSSYLDEISRYRSRFAIDAKAFAPPPTTEELMLMKFDKVVDHLLDCLRSTTDAASIDAFATALEKVMQAKDIFPQEET